MNLTQLVGRLRGRIISEPRRPRMNVRPDTGHLQDTINSRWYKMVQKDANAYLDVKVNDSIPCHPAERAGSSTS
jgi:hypothetical protein